ncbi:PE-PPE domain-containing protein [Tsukamurella sp. NPDC003166]|uniref:PE-PPE domain-containing protein n=1 Tax=Tsukamurella sp. NPDC003166 TaxID=3154444 RepID=UPI0033AEFD9A
MRETARKLGYVLVTLLGAIALTLTSAVAWAATTVLVVPGTGTKDPSKVAGYQEHAIGYYVAPTGACAVPGGCEATPVPYIAEFWPIPLSGWGGLQGAKWDDSVASGVTSLNTAYGAADKTDPIVIFGYSQGGTVVSAVKKQLAGQPGGVPDNVSFVLIGNASRPNGGLFTRPSFLGHIPILDVTFGPGTPTNTAKPGTINTTDVAFQYDGVADFPRYPVNLLATANALAGFWYVHGTMLAPKGSDDQSATPIGYTPDEVRAAVDAATKDCTAATYCQTSGDTRYITLPAKILPIMLPLLDLGAATGTTAVVRPFVDLVSPLARVIIETGYDRSDYGKATPFGLLPPIDPLRLGGDLLGAAVQGVGQAATGTGDASRYLAPTPTATATTTADAPTSGTEAPPAGDRSTLLQLARSAAPLPNTTSQAETSAAESAIPTEPAGSTEPAAGAGTPTGEAPSEPATPVVTDAAAPGSGAATAETPTGSTPSATAPSEPAPSDPAMSAPEKDSDDAPVVPAAAA